MKERDYQTPVNKERKNSVANPGHAPQGVDNAPGEETSENNIQFVQQTQKGKKVDGDPSQESDQPGEQDI
jgi:hypothetical protein